MAASARHAVEPLSDNGDDGHRFHSVMCADTRGVSLVAVILSGQLDNVHRSYLNDEARLLP